MSRANNVKFRILIASAILVSILLCGLSEAASLEVTRPVKVTDSEYYERGQSIVYDGAEYWLFYGRSASEQGWYQNGNPDVNDYEVYYKTATTVAGLSVATPTKIPGLNNSNSFLGETGTAHFGSEVWTFTTIVNGGSVDLYGWYHDGANWNEVSSLSTGLSSDSAHHDETAFNGEIFVVVRRSDDFYTTHTATPKSGGWSSEVAVGSTPGRCRFFVDGSELYLAVFNGQIPGENQIFFYETGTDSWTLVASTSSDGRDPTLFKVGDDYIFAQALWIGEGGGRQFILQWANNTLDANFFVNGPTMVSEGRYDTNTWVDMWPIGFTDAGGTSYLFFTSERDIPGQEGTGNIWYLEIDWDVYSGHHTYIKEAVTASSAAGLLPPAIAISGRPPPLPPTCCTTALTRLPARRRPV